MVAQTIVYYRLWEMMLLLCYLDVDCRVLAGTPSSPANDGHGGSAAVFLKI